MSANAKFPDGLANSSGMVGKNLMFNTYAQVNAIFEHELNEFKSAQVTRIVHDWYEHDPKRGFYGGGGIDGRIGPMPIAWSLFAPPPGRTWGAGFKSLLEALPRAMIVGDARHVAAARDQSHRPRPGAQGRVGPARVAHDVQGSSGRPGDGALPAGSGARDHAGRRRAGSLEGARSSKPRAPRTCSAPRAWATIRRPRSSTSTTARTTSVTCSSATVRAS